MREPNKIRGITLIELLVCIAIIGATAALTTPALSRMYQRYHLKIAARNLSNFLLQARTEAVKNASFEQPRFFRVIFDQNASSYYLQKYENYVGGNNAWTMEGIQTVLPAGISIYQVINGNTNPLATKDTYFYTPDGSLAHELLEIKNDGIPGTGDEATTPYVTTIRLKRGSEGFTVNVYSETGLTEVKEGLTQ